MRMHLVLVGVASLALAGCGQRVEHRGAVASGGAFNPGLYRSLVSRAEPEVSDLASAPVAALPSEAGRVVQVRTRRFANGLTQEIVLAADAATRGENMIEVAMRHEPEGERYENLVTMKRPDSVDIQKELEERFPGVDMRVQPYVLRNAYGPYGMAVGRQGGKVVCAYVWQWLDDVEGGRAARHVTLYATEASLRMRLCRQGASPRQLAELASSVVIDQNGALSMPVRPIGGAASGSDALTAASDESGAPARIAGFGGYRLPPGERAEPEAKPVRLASRPPARKTRTSRLASPRRPPPEPWGQGGPAQAYPAAASVPQAYPAVPWAAPAPSPARPAGPPRLDPSLPPEAYRGPIAAASSSARLR